MSASPPSKTPADRTAIMCGPVDEAQMNRLAGDLARATRAGDWLALSGDLGAGKTSFARAFIRAAAGDEALDVPSPTFTLVQNYAGAPPVTHVDLYRIGDASEVEELGLSEASARSVMLVEWPERAPSALPPERATITFTETERPDQRAISIEAPPELMERIERSRAIRRFLDTSGHGQANRMPLAGDASTRAYEIVCQADGWRAILMDSPPMPDGPPVRNGRPYSQIAHLAEDIGPFVAIARALRSAGFAAPTIEAVDLEQGLALIEDLGRGTIVDSDRRPIPQRYKAAIGCLAAMHAIDWPREPGVEGARTHRLPPLDESVMQIEVDLLVDWFAPRALSRQMPASARAEWTMAWRAPFERIVNGPKTLVMRDFHSPNIIWRDQAQGHDRIGLIDFQDALWGHPAYDVMSLVHDARIDVPAELQDELLDHYCALRVAGADFDAQSFKSAAAILSAQRASKILGIFVRLDERDGKPAYLRNIPRIQAYLRRALENGSLTELRAWFERHGLLDVTIGLK